MHLYMDLCALAVVFSLSPDLLRMLELLECVYAALAFDTFWDLHRLHTSWISYPCIQR